MCPILIEIFVTLQKTACCPGGIPFDWLPYLYVIQNTGFRDLDIQWLSNFELDWRAIRRSKSHSFRG